MFKRSEADFLAEYVNPAAEKLACALVNGDSLSGIEMEILEQLVPDWRELHGIAKLDT